MLQLSVVHRLPQLYRWSADQLGEIELLETTSGINDEDLVALRLLSHEGALALDILQQLRDNANAYKLVVCIWRSRYT
ncbi:hypothetical protein CRX72_22575 [Pantoea sp. BRM17]|nr:hypothetical protein CRX72_22575 [Pantoea sp. BRM17]